MKPHYFWLAEALELVTFFAIAPGLAVVIAYREWRDRKNTVKPKQYGMRCIWTGGAAALLLGLAKWIGADVGTPLYFLQLTCVLLSLLLFGMCEGYAISLLLGVWRWHKTTRPN